MAKSLTDQIVDNIMYRRYSSSAGYRAYLAINVDSREFNPPEFMNNLRADIIAERAAWLVSSQFSSTDTIHTKVILYASAQRPPR